MSKKDEALKLSLEALKKCDAALAEELAAWDIDPPLHHVQEASNACGPAISAIREALVEQPAQQPVAWMDAEGDVYKEEPPDGWCPPHTPLYTSPPASKPLTDEQITEHFKENVDTGSLLSFADGVRFAEAAHGIKGDA